MLKKVSVSIRVPEDSAEDSINEVLVIASKHESFKIPITAKIHLFENFNEAHEEHVKTVGRPLQNSRVRERLMRQEKWKG